jgi:hypothetical protein
MSFKAEFRNFSKSRIKRLEKADKNDYLEYKNQIKNAT